MGTPQKFALPSPNFNKKMTETLAVKPHFLTPSGMTLHARHQPPPMYGKRGATYPGKFLPKTNQINVATSMGAAAATAEPQFCEACDMELQSLDDLRRHRSQHEKCPVDNCNYSGHPSVMDKHVTTLHSSGLFDKFKKLSSPEEIAAWREERKRKYPTVENALMRQRAKEQREKRGERLEVNKSRFGKYDDRKRAQNNAGYSEKNQRKPNPPNKETLNNSQSKRKPNKRRRKEEKQKIEEKKQNEQIEKIKTVKTDSVREENDETERSCDGVFMFKGTGGLSNYQHFKPKKTKETNVLSGLLGMYGSDDSDEDDDADEIKGILEHHIKSEDETNNVERTINTAEKESPHTATSELQPVEKRLTDVTAENINLEEPENNSEILEKNMLNPQLKSNFLDNSHAIVDRKSETDASKKLEFSHEDTKFHTLKTEFGCTNFNSDSLNKKCLQYPDTVAVKKTENETSKNLGYSHYGTNLHTSKEDFGFSDDEGPEEVPIARSIDLPMPIKPDQSSEVSKEPTAGTTNSARDYPTTSKRTKSNQLNKLKSGLDYRKARLRKQNTLLEKLLEPDIRHERNVLLQCVRYVCENKFFGIGEKKKD